MHMTKMKKIAGILLAGAIIPIFIGGCNSSSSTVDKGEGTKDVQGEVNTGEKKEDIVIAMSQSLTTFDPIGAGSSSLQDQMVYRQIYARLFATDENMQPVQELADSYEKVSDTEYKFTILQGAKFSDGSEITAQDVAYSLERAHQSEAFATLMSTVSTIEATGDYEITITTTGPSPALLQALAHPGASILPKAYVEEAQGGGDWNSPITSGRYTVDEHIVGVSTKVVKNENYFRPDDAAQNNSLTFLNVAEDSTRTILVQTGEADISSVFSTADYNVVESDEKVTLHEKAGTTIQYIGFDVTQEPFDNELVRQAVAYGLDREGIMSVATEGLGQVSYTVIPPATLGHLDDNPGAYEYNIEKAKELLAEGGYENGFETTIVVFSDTGKTIATVAQGYLDQIGIKAKVEQYDTSVRMDMFANHQCPMFSAQWGALADAELVLPRLFTQGAAYNWSHYNNDEVNNLLQKARETEDSNERASIYAEAVAIIDKDAPWVPVYVPNAYALANANLQGVTLDGEGLMNLHALHY